MIAIQAYLCEHCAKGHDLEKRYATPFGDMEGGLRHNCPDWT